MYNQRQYNNQSYPLNKNKDNRNLPNTKVLCLKNKNNNRRNVNDLNNLPKMLIKKSGQNKGGMLQCKDYQYRKQGGRFIEKKDISSDESIQSLNSTSNVGLIINGDNNKVSITVNNGQRPPRPKEEERACNFCFNVVGCVASLFQIAKTIDEI